MVRLPCIIDRRVNRDMQLASELSTRSIGWWKIRWASRSTKMLGRTKLLRRNRRSLTLSCSTFLASRHWDLSKVPRFFGRRLNDQHAIMPSRTFSPTTITRKWKLHSTRLSQIIVKLSMPIIPNNLTRPRVKASTNKLYIPTRNWQHRRHTAYARVCFATPTPQ